MSKVKILKILMVVLLMGYSGKNTAAQEYFNPDYMLNECLEHAIDEADKFKSDGEFFEEIESLINASEVCEDGHKLYTRISLKYLELGDSNYNESEKGNAGEKKIYFEEGLAWAKQAIAADSLNHKGYEMVSTSYAAIVSESGLRGKANLADSVRLYAERALELNPKNDRAIHILGRWHFEVAKLGWFTKFMAGVLFGNKPEGSIEKAIKYFKMSVALDDFPVHRYWLGRAYLEAGEKDKAIEQLEYLQTLPNRQKNDEYFKKEAQMLINKHS